MVISTGMVGIWIKVSAIYIYDNSFLIPIGNHGDHHRQL